MTLGGIDATEKQELGEKIHSIGAHAAASAVSLDALFDAFVERDVGGVDGLLVLVLLGSDRRIGVAICR